MYLDAPQELKKLWEEIDFPEEEKEMFYLKLSELINQTFQEEIQKREVTKEDYKKTIHEEQKKITVLCNQLDVNEEPCQEGSLVQQLNTLREYTEELERVTIKKTYF